MPASWRVHTLSAGGAALPIYRSRDVSRPLRACAARRPVYERSCSGVVCYCVVRSAHPGTTCAGPVRTARFSARAAQQPTLLGAGIALAKAYACFSPRTGLLFIR